MGRLGKKRQSRIQDRLLTLLVAPAQALGVAGDFAYHPYPYVYAALGMSYRKSSIDAAANELARKGLLEKNEREGLRLTSAGANVKQRLYQARCEEWDGRWRVVIFDIPERERKIRDDFRFELKKLGLGPWQKSVWVTPFDISAELGSYLQKQNLATAVQIVVGERFGGPSDREFAATIWPLEDLSKKYASLLGSWGEELSKERSAKERLRMAAVLHNRYLDILAGDPQLPSRLLPPNWGGRPAQELFKRLRSTLSVSKPS